MPCDKLVLLSPEIRPFFRKIAEHKGKPIRGYFRYHDLRQTVFNLPVRLYCGGFRRSMNKLQFDGVAHLTPARVREIVIMICGADQSVRIFRIDFCVDVMGISVDEIVRSCRLKNAQNYSFIKSRTGTTAYLRFAKQNKLLVYDRLGRLRAIDDPLAGFYRPEDILTRIEVQWQGKGVPFQDFDDLDRYVELDPLSGLSFWNVNRTRANLTVPEALAAEGLLRKIETYGMQGASKMYSSQTWAYLTKRSLAPSTEGRFSDLKGQMRKSIREWLENRIRFPRLLRRANLG
jgi:hypothetical protein